MSPPSLPLALLALLACFSPAASLTVAVTGATGNVGRAAVQRLVADGDCARILLRHEVSSGSAVPPAADADSSAVASYLVGLPGVEAVRGDINDPASLRDLLVGCDAVIAAHGARRTRKLSDFWRDPTHDPAHAKNVNYEGMKSLLAAAAGSGTCKRVVRITGKGETPWSFFSILLNGLGGMAKAWNYEGERLMRACSVDYTIVRPGVMSARAELPPSSLALADNGGDLKVTPIPPGAIADLCVDCLRTPNAARATLTAMRSAEPGAGSGSWGQLLAGVRPDRRAFRSDLLEAHQTAVRVGGTALALAGLALASAAALAVKAALSAVLPAVLAWPLPARLAAAGGLLAVGLLKYGSG